MPELTLRFLGTPEIVVDGASVHLPRQRSLALLAYLVLSGRPHAREELAALLSGEMVGSQERKLLRNALTTLAEQLGDYLRTDRQTIAFNAALPCQLDIATLDTILADMASPDLATLEWAVAQYDCELLAGLSLRDAPLFESWLVRTREHVRHQLAQIAQRLLEHYLGHGRLDQGIALARRLLAIEPWQEGIHRQLMRLLARNGQQAAALAQFALCRKALLAELGVEPHPETTALYERLLAAPFSPRHNLPVPSSTLVGREDELAEITRRLVAPDCRLVTIVGLGGSGKSRVALAAASHFVTPTPLADDHPFPDGCFLVDLSGISGAGHGQEAAFAAERRLAMAIGLALGLVFYGHVDRVDQLVAFLCSKRILLILDGLERLIPSAEALRRILKEASGVTLLATSRARLGIPEEHVRTLGRLELPSGPEALEQAQASQLFLNEVVRMNTHLAAEDRVHIVTICRLVHGLPLALKIAASWLRALSCAQIARDLAHGGRILKEPTRHQADRHEDLDAIMAFTWRSLPARERRVLRQLSVFDGHFDHQAAATIGIELSSLLLLCEHALIERAEHGGYLLHPLVRQYGLDQLSRWPTEEIRVRVRHAAHYADLIARLGPELYERPEAHAIVRTDRLNALVAWHWAVEHLDLGLIAKMRDGLTTWHRHAGLSHAWIEVLEATVEKIRAALADREDLALRVTLGWILTATAESLVQDRHPERAYPLLVEARQCARMVGMIPLEARICLCEGNIRLIWGEYRAAEEPLQQALALARATGDTRIATEVQAALAVAAVDLGQYAEAEAQLAQAEQAFRQVGDRLASGRLAIHRARMDIERGEFVRARGILEQSLHLVREFGDRPRELQTYTFMGMICDIGMGLHQEADRYFSQGFKLAREVGNRRSLALLSWGQGRNALHVGDLPRADALLQEALTTARDLGSPFTVSRALRAVGALALARGEVSRARDLAQQAIQLASDAGQRQQQASALLLLAHAQERHRLLPEAAATYAQALALAREVALPTLGCEAEAGLASVALAEGEVGEATARATNVLAYLEAQSLAGCEEPGAVVLTCYQALQATRERRAVEALRLGSVIIEQRVAALLPEDRERYLDVFPARRQVLIAWRDLQSAEKRRRVPISLFPLPSAAASTECVASCGA